MTHFGFCPSSFNLGPLSLFHLISLCGGGGGGVALFNGVCRGFITYCPSKEFYFLIELKWVTFFYWFKCKMINDMIIKKLSFLEVYEWE